MKSLPDMIFANNSIKLKHENGFEIEFNAKDALNLCEKEKCPDNQMKIMTILLTSH